MSSAPASSLLPDRLRAWLADHATALDEGNTHTGGVLPALADADLFRIGVPRPWGGVGGDVRDATEAIAAVSEQSLAAGFMFWGHRAFIEYLLQSTNEPLRERWLPVLMSGRHAGATGLSNAMKFLSGIEALQVRARADGPGWRLDGALPWATNLRTGRFIVAAAVELEGGVPFIAALPSDRPGLSRSDDLDLIAMRGSDTASLKVEALAIDASDVIADNAREYLPRVRPAFLGLQCGLSIGLARAALAAAKAIGGSSRAVLQQPIDDAQAALKQSVNALNEGLSDRRFVAQAAGLFGLRIRLAEIVQQAVSLELQASGGRAYHRDQPLGFARRWREAAFIPIVTPSLTQLQGELLKQAAQAAA